MFIKKYWTSIQESTHFNGKNILLTCYGGSNISIADAEVQAHKKLPIMLDKIKGILNLESNYTVEIREEVFKEINSSNIVTRNRYGALVLNSENLPIIDIDQPKSGFFDLFRGSKSLEDNKKKIYSQVKAVAAKSAYARIGFRI